MYTRKPAVHARTNFMRPFAEAPAPPEWKGHVRATLMRESKKLQSFKAKTVGRPYRPSLLVSEYLLPMLTNTSHPTPRTHLAPIKCQDDNSRPYLGGEVAPTSWYTAPALGESLMSMTQARASKLFDAPH